MKLSYVELPKVLTLVFGIILLIFAREPSYFLGPRVWAEEGSIYIQYYLENGLMESLLKAHLGYFSFFNNFAIGISLETLGLKWVAYGTTSISLFFVLICCLAPLYIPSRYWSTNSEKFILIIFSILVASPEIWLNTINIQFYLGLFACYLLIGEPSKLSRRGFLFASFALLIGAFTGVTSIIFLPFYAYKALKSTKREQHSLDSRWVILTAILTVGFLVQLVVFLTTLDSSPVPRLSLDAISNLPIGLINTTVYVLKGNSQTASLMFGLVVAAIGFVAFFKNPKGRFVAVLVIYVSAVFTLLSIQMTGGGRYGYIPSVLVVIYFISYLAGRLVPYRRTALSLAALFFLYKLQFYFETENYYDQNWQPFSVEYGDAISNDAGYVRVRFPQ